MKDTDYAYAVARIRANERNLMHLIDLESLITLKDEKQILSVLKAHGWSVNESEEINASDIIKNENEKLWKLLCESVPDKEELRVFTVINDFFNIKAALKCFFCKTDPKPYFVYPTSVDLDTVKTAFEKNDFSFISEDLAHSVKEAFDTLNETGYGQNADIILDRAALEHIMKLGKKSSCSLVGEISHLICTQTNIKIAIRCAKAEKSFSFCKNALCKCDDMDIDEISLYAEKGEKELLEYFDKTKWSQTARLLSEDAVAFEKWLDDRVVTLSKRAKFVFLGFEPICAYYYAKTAEIKCVRIILAARKSGLSEAAVKERLRELYV